VEIKGKIVGTVWVHLMNDYGLLIMKQLHLLYHCMRNTEIWVLVQRLQEICLNF